MNPSRADGGLLDGGRAECATFRDCPLPDSGLPFCPSPVRSCVAGRCLSECSSPSRSCDVTDGGSCLRCSEPASQTCALCVRARRCEMVVSNEGCPAPFVSGSRFNVVPSTRGACGGEIFALDGGASLGTWADLETGLQGLLSIPALGGSCVSTSLATGAPRAAVACPACTFVEVGCE